MANIRISQSGIGFLQDLDHYLQEADLAGQDPTLLFRDAQQMGVILRILEDGPDEGIDRDYLVAIVVKQTAWTPEKVKRLIGDLYEHGSDSKKIEVYVPDVDYAPGPGGTERGLGTRKIEELKRIHRMDQYQGRKADAWCEKCQRYHFGDEACPYCE